MKTNVYITNRATHHDDGVSCIEKAQSRAETDAIVPKDRCDTNRNRHLVRSFY